MRFFTIYQSPLGPITIVEESGSITAVTFSEPPSGAFQNDQSRVLSLAKSWLRDYFGGKCPDPSILPTSPKGTPFQIAVWELLKTIPYGKTISYGALAKKLGPKMSSQAIGQAVGRNPIAIIIPCHRVIGADGSLTGYAAGIPRKKYLLELEGILTSPANR